MDKLDYHKIARYYIAPTILKERLLKPFFEGELFLGPVLDIGCGTGYFTELIAKRNIEVTGIDAVADHFPQTHSKNSTYQKINATKITLPVNYYSEILLINLLSTMTEESRIEVLSEVKRIKKPKTKIYCVSMSESSVRAEIKNDLISIEKINNEKVHLKFKLVNDKYIDFDDFIVTESSLIKQFEELNFKVVDKKYFSLESGQQIYTLFIIS